MLILSCLLLAWFLTWFNFDDIVCDAIHELFNKEISTATYYLFFFTLGLTGEVIEFLSKL